MIEDKAKDLGRAIGQSDEYKAVKRSSEALNLDAESTKLLRRMEAIRTEAQALIDKGSDPTPEMEQELDTLLGQVQTHAAYQRAVVAQDNFDKLMLRVNSWIADGIRTGATSSIILG